MRYVIVSVVNGVAGEFNNNLRKDVFNKFKARSSKLPAHFTIKSPFEYDGDISDLENAIKRIAVAEKAEDYKIIGYNHFDNRVIYMDVEMSPKGKEVHDKFIDELSKVPYINFRESDGKDKVFHVTVTSKKIQNMYNELWDYVNRFQCKFNCKFDNVCIYMWRDNTWKLYKRFDIGSSTNI